MLSHCLGVIELALFNLSVSVMVLFSSDPSNEKLVSILNSILLLLYCLHYGLYFSPISEHQSHDLIVALRLVVRIGKSLGLNTYDSKI